MLLCEGGGGPVKSRLRVRDDVNGYRFHQMLKTALGDETAHEPGLAKLLRNAKTKAASYHQCPATLRQHNIPRNGAEAQAKALKRRRSKTIPASERSLPVFRLVSA